MIGAPSFNIKGTRVSDILREHDKNPKDVTFLSIDIDGSDLEVFEDLDFTPPVILLEGGFNYNPYISEKIDLDYAAADNQHPLGAVNKIVHEKGYELLCFFQDSYLVRKDLSKPFEAQIAMSHFEIYRDAWNFGSEELRSYLRKRRREDQFLIDFETKHLGTFSEDPTAITK